MYELEKIEMGEGKRFLQADRQTDGQNIPIIDAYI